MVMNDQIVPIWQNSSVCFVIANTSSCVHDKSQGKNQTGKDPYSGEIVISYVHLISLRIILPSLSGLIRVLAVSG
jgi:hypothetical protein